MPKCVVPSCKFKNSNSIKRSFFSCLNVERARLWEKYIPGIDVLNPNDYICDIHFEKSKKVSCNHIRHGQYYTLLKEAVPTIFNVSNAVGQHTSAFPVNNKEPSVGESSLQHVVQEMAEAEKMLKEIKTEVFSDTEDAKIKIENQLDFINLNKNNGEKSAIIKITPYEELQINLEKYASALPDSWRVSSLTTNNDELFIFSKECTVVDEMTLLFLIEKNIVLNSNNELHYSIYGRSFNTNNPNLPKMLINALPNIINNIEVLPDIIILFNSISTCQGLYIKEFDENKDCEVYKDNLGYYRHVNCTLASEKLQCYHCEHYTKDLLSSLNNINVKNVLSLM